VAANQRTHLGFGLERRDARRPLGVGHGAAVVREAREDGVDRGALAVGEPAHLWLVGVGWGCGAR